MKVTEMPYADKHLFYRIIALWAVCEGMLGGIIHGFNLPGTGLIISSASVTCISMIAWHYPAKGIILKATIIVSIFKMMLSPHSPPTAYIAVFFQGLMGELLFAKRKYFKFSCLMLAILALVESAIQRLLVLTIVYGNAFWKAINMFISKLTGEKHVTNYSWYIAIGYVLLHLIAGYFVGRFISRLPSRIIPIEYDEETGVADIPASIKRKKSVKAMIVFTWLVLLALYIQSSFKFGKPLLPASLPLQIIIRSVIIVFLWYFVASPLLALWMKKWLAKKQSRLKDEVKAIVEMIPSTKKLLAQSWKQTSNVKGVRRLGLFAKIALYRTLRSENYELSPSRSSVTIRQ